MYASFDRRFLTVSGKHCLCAQRYSRNSQPKYMTQLPLAKTGPCNKTPLCPGDSIKRQTCGSTELMNAVQTQPCFDITNVKLNATAGTYLLF